MKNNNLENYEKDLKNPLSISKTESLKNRKRIKNFIEKKIFPKIKDFEGANNELSFEWEDLLEKLLDSGTNLDQETIDSIVEIMACHMVINMQIKKIKESKDML